MKKYFACLLGVALIACGESKKDDGSFSLNEGLKDVTNIKGEKNNGDYLYVTAGDRLYSIGNQYGEFPDVGFHVPGEMGGVWYHPIKLLDAYTLTISDKASNMAQTLGKCDQFITYPFANQFKYEGNQDLSIIRTDFVPDSLGVLVVEYSIENKSAAARKIDLSFDVDTDLSPVWLGERCNMIDSRDQLVDGGLVDNTVFAKDSLNNWYVGITSESDSITLSDTKLSPRKGQGVSMKISLPTLDIAANQQRVVRFYVGGSVNNTDEISKNLTFAKKSIANLFNKKKTRYDEIDRTAAITVPDTLMTQAYKWGKYNTDWLVREVPGLGRGINAGLPDYPWYFSNDQGATFGAILGTRDPKLFYDSWEMMLRVSKKDNDSGGIIHEVSTNGVVYAKDRMEESQEFIVTAWNIFKWTGDKEFLKTYYEHGKIVWEFLKKHDKNNNLYIEGAGGVEIEGLTDEMLDVAVWTQSYFKAMSQMALVFDDTTLSRDFAAKAETLRENINRDWWIPSENRYADFRSDKKKAIQLIDAALEKRVIAGRNEWARKKLTELKQQILSGEYKQDAYVVFYNPTLQPLMEDIADEHKAQAVLKGMEFFTNKFGMYVAGIARPDDITLEEGSVKHRLKGDFNYNEAIMPAATTGMIMAECKYNGADASMKYIKQYLNNFSFATPGTTYEVSPDYGMFVQAWNVSALNVPLIQYMFGVDPYAYEKKITVKPDMPSAWNFAKLERLLIGDTKLSIDFKRDGGKLTYKIDSEKEGWTIKFVAPKNAKTIKVNGKEVGATNGAVDLIGKNNAVEVLN